MAVVFRRCRRSRVALTVGCSLGQGLTLLSFVFVLCIKKRSPRAPLKFAKLMLDGGLRLHCLENSEAIIYEAVRYSNPNKWGRIDILWQILLHNNMKINGFFSVKLGS